MRTLLTLLSLVSVCAESAASTVTYTYFDPERDETFEVYALVDGDEFTGLATFDISLSGLESTPLDPETIVFTTVGGGPNDLRGALTRADCPLT